MNSDQIEMLHKEIDLIQICINRMAQNSFFIKGWAISILAVVLSLSNDSAFSLKICILLLIVLGSFWWLDAYFLHIERLYRKLYEDVIEKRRQNNWDSLYDLNSHRFRESVGSHWKVMFSASLSVFYGFLTTVILVWLIIEGIYIYWCG
jgi:hypothetical protein